jgi:hypothetical protein
MEPRYYMSAEVPMDWSGSIKFTSIEWNITELTVALGGKYPNLRLLSPVYEPSRLMMYLACLR